ncbi:MAG: phosphatidate cytidylyltransferase [Clostridia bacterium]|nr:phosphatidate cytidylyltransferase [Clostridia bacterium]
MKTRIISAAIIISIVFAVLFTGYRYTTVIITVFIALLATAASYELLHHIVKAGTAFRKAAACVYAAVAFVLTSDIMHGAYDILRGKGSIDERGVSFSITLLLLSAIVYTVLFTVSIIFKKKEFNITEIFALLGAPFIYSAAFASLDCIITRSGGIYYLLLVINFSSVCDTGAYFTGVFFGRHKLCEHVSPKKTIEGAVGGVAASLIVTFVLVWAYKAQTNIFVMLGVTVVMCIVGMLGDLFASIIKRSVGVKDYSNLIPGHGGILDRFDSMLFISPAMLSLMLLGVIK